MTLPLKAYGTAGTSLTFLKKCRRRVLPVGRETEKKSREPELSLQTRDTQGAGASTADGIYVKRRSYSCKAVPAPGAGAGAGALAGSLAPVECPGVPLRKVVLP